MLALMSGSDSKLILQVSDGHDEEIQMLFAYIMYSSRSTVTVIATPVPVNDQTSTESKPHAMDQTDAPLQETMQQSQEPVKTDTKIPQPEPES